MTGGNIFGVDPATGLKVAVDALDEYRSEDEASDYTVIPVHEEDNDSISAQNPGSIQGGENFMVSDRWLRVQANTRRHAEKSAVQNLKDLGADLDEAAFAARAAGHMYADAAGDRDEARELLERTLDEDADRFNYVAEALDHYSDVVNDEVISPLEDIDHDKYDLSRVESALDSAEAYWDSELPDDPSDLTSH